MAIAKGRDRPLTPKLRAALVAHAPEGLHLRPGQGSKPPRQEAVLHGLRTRRGPALGGGNLSRTQKSATDGCDPSGPAVDRESASDVGSCSGWRPQRMPPRRAIPRFEDLHEPVHFSGLFMWPALSECPRCAQSRCCSGVIGVGVSPAGTELHRIVSSKPGAEKTNVNARGDSTKVARRNSQELRPDRPQAANTAAGSSCTMSALRTTAHAPNSKADKVTSPSRCSLTMTTLTAGWICRMYRQASRPFIRGMKMSVTTTSGTNSPTRRRSSSPSTAVETTSQCGSKMRISAAMTPA